MYYDIITNACRQDNLSSYGGILHEIPPNPSVVQERIENYRFGEIMRHGNKIVYGDRSPQCYCWWAEGWAGGLGWGCCSCTVVLRQQRNTWNIVESDTRVVSWLISQIVYHNKWQEPGGHKSFSKPTDVRWNIAHAIQVAMIHTHLSQIIINL